jgi:hypothetical protein
MARYVTFSFDDGIITTARRVKTLNIPTTFYIVLGWTLNEIEIKDSYNVNLDHGSIQEWIDSKLDVGCHTYDHNKNFNESLSFNRFSVLFNGPRNLATPYGIDHTTSIYDSCKVGHYKSYNDLTATNLKRLCSINPIYDFKETIDFESIVKKCPDEQWIILTFHGIDEGWCPVEYKELEFWKSFFINNDFTFMTVSDGAKKICKKYLL